LHGNGEASVSSRLAVPGGAIRADCHFLHDFLTFPTWIIRVVLFALAGLVAANERVRPGTIRILLAAPFQDTMLAGNTGRHDALTQLTAEHGNEPME
jgi:hypothetical protein